MVDDAVAWVAVLLWVTAAVEAVNVARRRHPEPALNMLLATFVMLAVSATFFVPAVHLAAGRATGVANIGEPVARTALLGAAWSVQVMLQRLGDQGTARTRARRRGAVMVVFVIALWALFLLAPVDRPTRMFTRDYGAVPIVAVYIAVSLAYLAFALLDVIQGSLRYARSATGSLVVSLRLIGLGCVFGLGYVAVKAVFLVLLATGRGSGQATLESSVGRLLAVGGGLLVIAGSTLPFVSSRSARMRAGVGTWRDLRRLYPLWALMYRATPGIALDPPRSALTDALRIRDLDLRLYRRVIEIRDGRLALTAYIDAAPVAAHRASAAVQGTSDVYADAAAEAAALLDAVQRKQRNDMTCGPAAPAPDASAGLADEVDWLRRVAHHLRRPRVTRHPGAAENAATTSTPRTAP